MALAIEEVPYVGLSELVVSVPVFCFFGVVVSKWDINSPKLRGVITHMGENGIAIFVLHWSVINFIRAFGIMPDEGHFLIGRQLWTIIVYTISYGLSLLWERIPVFRKVI